MNWDEFTITEPYMMRPKQKTSKYEHGSERKYVGVRCPYCTKVFNDIPFERRAKKPEYCKNHLMVCEEYTKRFSKKQEAGPRLAATGFSSELEKLKRQRREWEADRQQWESERRELDELRYVGVPPPGPRTKR